MSPLKEKRLKGIPVSPGIAMGVLRMEMRGSVVPPVRGIRLDEADAEWARFESALTRTEEELHALKARVEHMSGAHEAAIFDAHLLFLRDNSILKKLRKEFAERMQNIDAVYYAVVQNFMEIMRHVEDPYLRSRVADIEDVLLRVMKNMEGRATAVDMAVAGSEPCVLAAYDLSPSGTADLDRSVVQGFATEVGSGISHTAILARSLGLPAVVGIHQLIVDSRVAQPVILDGFEGLLILNPRPETLEYYTKLRAKKEKAYQALVEMRDLPSVTKDGRVIRLAANVEFAHEYNTIKESGAEGVGLYRTEFFLLGGHAMPDEETQYQHYKELVEACAHEEVIFRTLDSGGDKLPFEVQEEKEENPFLGWRGVRVSLSRPDGFKEQLRAIMRCSAHGKVGVMFPMVSGLTEVLEIKKLLDECRQELRARGEAFDEKMRVGIMIEVPSAAMIADILAKEVDFFSIGTNDLTQYTIAVDRVNNRVADMFRPAHPGVIRLINSTIAAGIPTAICGEMGADLTLLPLLVGMGAEELSVGTYVVPLVRYAIRHLDYAACKAMAQEALKAGDSYTIRELSEKLARESYPNLFDDWAGDES